MSYLILENGKIFEGQSIGALTECCGEIVFNTSMVGYLEILTDGSNAGKIVVQSFPMIGNYGINEDDAEGKCSVAGYIVREICEEPSNFRCECSLKEYLLKNNIPTLYGIDTRELTGIIRKEGSMRAIICEHFPKEINFDAYAPKEIIPDCFAPKSIESSQNSKYKIAVIDLGASKTFCDDLLQMGCDLILFPTNAEAHEILSYAPDALLVSHGPHDPAKMTKTLETIKQLLGVLPIFASGLGNQLLALALGAKVYKLKYGHRGANHPVKCVESGKTYISRQNHGYCVSDQLPSTCTAAYINENDKSIEGIECSAMSAFGVDFYPQGKNFTHLYDKFFTLIDSKRNKQ